MLLVLLFIAGGNANLANYSATSSQVGTSKVTVAVNGTTGVNRTTHLTGGDYSGSPFLTIQSALDALPKSSAYRRIVNVASYGSAYAGYNLSGFTGGGDVVVSFANTAPSITGPATGAAGVGSTTSTINLPTGAGTNWASDTLRRYFVVVSSSDSDLPYIRPIKSKTNTSFTFDVIPGVASGTAFNIVKTATTLGAGSSTFGGFNVAGVYSFNSSPVRTLFAAPVASLDYQFYSTGNALDEWHGLSITTASNYQSVYSTGDLYSEFNDSYASAGASLQQYGGTAELQNDVSDGGISNITGVNSAIVQLDSASVTAGIPLTVRRVNNVVVGFKGASNTAASAALFDSCTSLTLQNAGLTGTGNSQYGVEFANGGQYNVSGASITGTSGNFTIDGSTSSAQTWTNLSTYQAMSRYAGGTLLLAGSSAAEVYTIESFLIGGNNFDVSFAQEQHGGRNINYGFFHFATAIGNGSSADGLAAHIGGGQGSATVVGLGTSVFTTVASDHDSGVLNAGVIGGMLQVVSNFSSKILDLYPPVGGKINSGTTDNPYSIAAGKIGIFWTRDDASGGKDFMGYAVTP